MLSAMSVTSGKETKKNKAGEKCREAREFLGRRGKIAWYSGCNGIRNSVVRVNDSFYEDKRPRAINARRMDGAPGADGR